MPTPTPTFENFENVAKLGQGGMGEVYSAHDPRTGRDVALKVLPPNFVRDPERLARFQREAKVLGSLNHPNIATLYGVDESDGHPFLIMELAEGKDLSEVLRDGPLSLDQALNIALQIAQGLEEAHEKGIIHRDLKPANIMLAPDGKVKILDFGLARAYDGGSTEETDSLNSPTITAAMTAAGTILGTAAYMSPEQARGRGIDRRSDLWAFGAVLWEMMTGKRLFQGETISDTLAEILKSTPPWDELPSDTPHGIRSLLERCLERDAQNRLRDIGEARIRLQKWEADPSQLDDSFGSYARGPVGSHKIAWLPWSVAGVAIAAVLFLIFNPRQRPEVAAEPLMFSIRLDDDANMSTTNAVCLEMSNDGNYIMWTTPAGLHLKHRASNTTQLVPLIGGFVGAKFSTDSKWIAISHAGILYRRSITGGQLIKICDMGNPRGFDWVDEETIIIAPSFSVPLKLVSVATGETKPLTELNDQERTHRWPSMIPGTRLALFMTQMVGGDYQEAAIEVVDIDTGVRKIVYRGGSYPRYSPTGHILFARDFGIFAVKFDLKTQTTQGLAVPVLQDVLTRVADQELDDGSAQFAFDLQGNMVYRSFKSRKQAKSSLAWLDLKSGSIAKFGLPAIYGHPKISPNGNFLAYRRNNGVEAEIVVLSFETGSDLVISDRKGMKYGGTWSRDSQIYYWAAANKNGDGFEIMSAHRQGGATPKARVTTANAIFAIDVSPDGRWLLVDYFSGRNAYEIGIVDLTKEDLIVEPYQISPKGQNSIGFDSSGKFILYNSSSNNLDNLFLSRFPDTGDRWRVGASNIQFAEYLWAPDGSGVYFRDHQELSFLPVDLKNGVNISNQRSLVTAEPGIRQNDTNNMSIHPDGKRAIIFISDSNANEGLKAQVIFRNDWFAEIERIMSRQ